MKASKVARTSLLIRLILSLSTLGILSSCVQEEIEPAFEARTILEQRENRPVRVHYPIREVEVDRIGGGIAKFPLLGGVFRRIGEVFADVTVAASGGTKIDTEPTVLKFPELDEVDFDLIKYISLEDVYINAVERDRDRAASLSFIREINVYLTTGKSINLDGPSVGGDEKVDDESRLINRFRDLFPDKERMRVLSYKRGKNKLDCDDSCLRFSVERTNWKRILQENRVFMIEVEIVVSSVPRRDMKIDGGVNLSFGVDLGF